MDDCAVTYGRLVTGDTAADAAYNALAPAYDRSYQSPKDVAENAYLAHYLDRAGYCEGNVLDAGCGTGLLLDLCAVDPNGYAGIDVSDAMLQQARAKHPGYWFARGDITRLTQTVQPHCIDNALYLFGTFSYAVEQKFAVNSLATVLRPGGRFFIMALSHRYPDRASYFVAREGFSVPIITYDAESLRALFSDDGRFADIRVRGLSLIVDRLNWLGTRLLSAAYQLDALVGRVTPDRAAYICVEGRLR